MDEKHMKGLALNKYADAKSEQENKYSIPKETYQINGVSVGHLVPNEEYVVIQKKYVDELKRKLEVAQKKLSEFNDAIQSTNNKNIKLRTKNDNYILDLFKERYTVTKDGKIFSNYYKNRYTNKKLDIPKELKQTTNAQGYKKVEIGWGDKRKPYYVHRIVALVYLGKPDNENLIAGHINDIKSDNRVENIKWMTVKENAKYADLNGVICNGVKHGNHLFSKEEIKKIIIMHRLGKSITFIAKHYKTDNKTIKNIVFGISYKNEFTEALKEIE